MAFFKKIASFFFEETEEDVVLEEELQLVDIKKKDPPKVTEPVKEEVISPVEIKKTPLSEAQHVDTSMKQEVEDENHKFVNIDITEQKETVKKVKEAVSETKRETVVERSIRKEKVEYEFTPVISPIFGSTEDETKPRQAKKVHSSSVMSKRTSKKNPLGTIISPYFGVNELEEFEEKAQKRIQDKDKTKRDDIRIEPVVQVEPKEKVKSMSLADMLLGDDSISNEESPTQIPQFGETDSACEIEYIKVNEK